MDEMELLKNDLVFGYKKHLDVVEHCKSNIALGLNVYGSNKPANKKEKISSMKMCRDIIQKNEKILKDIRRTYSRYFGSLDELLMLEKREGKERELIIRLDI